MSRIDCDNFKHNYPKLAKDGRLKSEAEKRLKDIMLKPTENINDSIAAQDFIAAFDEIQQEVHKTAIEKGWYEDDRGNPELIALIHSELSECLEALRKGDGMDEHCPTYKNSVIELADVVIRCMDMAEHNKWPLAEAVIAKMEFNKTRPHKHGKKF